MAKTVPVGWEPVEIGRRARAIRCHRGLSLAGVAERAGMSADHLSMLESGERRFARQTQEYLDQDRYAHAGRDLGTLLTELHVHAATGNAGAGSTRDSV